MRTRIASGLLILSLGLLTACNPTVVPFEQQEVLIQAQSLKDGTNTAANLMATALRESNALDIVLYPRELIQDSQMAILSKSGIDADGQIRLLSMFPNDVQDQFRIGTMKGSDIKDLITQRSFEAYKPEIDVAGLIYHVHFTGGFLQFANFYRPDNLKFSNDEYYRVAISNFFYFSGATFPSYKYRNGLTSRFRDLGIMVSAKESLKKYLAADRIWPDLKERRALVTRNTLGEKGFLPISQIQGIGHRSPYFAQTVTTRGIVTAVGSVEWYPGGTEVIIQSETPDTDPRTSEGLMVYLENDLAAPQLGNVIEVRGVVYEHMTRSGLGMTSLREIKSIQKVEKENKTLPTPVRLGAGGLPIPNDVISKWRGNLNLKPSLDLSDAIDFWESLEGMRVTINNARVVGFRGGQESFEDVKPKGYLTLYVRPDADIADPQDSGPGGIVLDFPRQDYNPNIVQISTNHLTAPLAPTKVFNVGQWLKGRNAKSREDADITGVIVYQKNLFASGEYNLVLPELPKAVIDAFNEASPTTTDLPKRPTTRIKASENQLSIASFNVENLGGNQTRRIEKLGEALALNLNCPDIVNLVEIQDENGSSSIGNSSGAKTLENVIAATNCPGKTYKHVNIDPITNAEGGQPGGNIRVALIYDSKKVGFTPKVTPSIEPTDLTATLVTRDGHLTQNPGRIFPRSPSFSHVRRSLVTEFSFRGQTLLMIGNHLNSKLGDSSPWMAEQPAYFRSEDKRITLANQLNAFVQYALQQSPNGNILVSGDFNAFETEKSMAVLAGRQLKNVMVSSGFVPANERYSTNYNGNSQCIDHIYASDSMMKRVKDFEVLHINSDFMGRISDHDPVIGLFQF